VAVEVVVGEEVEGEEEEEELYFIKHLKPCDCILWQTSRRKHRCSSGACHSSLRSSSPFVAYQIYPIKHNTTPEWSDLSEVYFDSPIDEQLRAFHLKTTASAASSANECHNEPF